LGAKKSQDPDGLIEPSTSLQLAGGWNCTQASQRAAPFAASLYPAWFFGTLEAASARPLASSPPAMAPPSAQTAPRVTLRRETFAELGRKSTLVGGGCRHIRAPRLGSRLCPDRR
jgi:hypothetical protein